MYVERSITRRFHTASRTSSIVAIVGPRQSGKTTFLKAQAKGAATYLLFDDPDVRELFDEDIKKFESQYALGGAPTILDEVQYGKGAGSKLKYLADTGKKLWITSSSQTLLGKEVLGWLVGRVAILTLYPFSLAEFMSAKRQKQTTAKITARLMDEHMRYGGYPKIVLEEEKENKEDMLRDLYETMVLKDVARTFGIEDVGAIERVAVYLSHSVGNVLVYNNICAELGLSFQSVKKYLDAMEKSYIVERIAPFYRNKLKEVTKQPKVYFFDTGMRNVIANEFMASRETKGALFENYVFTELIKAGASVRFWQSKSKAEVDFVVQKGDEIIPIECKLKERGARIGRSMLSFIGAYKPKRGFVVFLEGVHSRTKKERCTVEFTDVPGLLSRLFPEKWAL